jgi:hypothetical protein
MTVRGCQQLNSRNKRIAAYVDTPMQDRTATPSYTDIGTQHARTLDADRHNPATFPQENM